MLVDTSAVIAILLSEPEAARMIAAITKETARFIAAPTVVEATAVILVRKGVQGQRALNALVERLGLTVVPMSPHAAELAQSAYVRYGKGVAVPGVLNYGDCLAYGVAMDMSEPLLFKGNDFSRTDVPAVTY